LSSSSAARLRDERAALALHIGDCLIVVREGLELGNLHAGGLEDRLPLLSIGLPRRALQARADDQHTFGAPAFEIVEVADVVGEHDDIGPSHPFAVVADELVLPDEEPLADALRHARLPDEPAHLVSCVLTAQREVGHQAHVVDAENPHDTLLIVSLNVAEYGVGVLERTRQ